MIVAVDFDNTLALGNYSHISLLAPNRLLIRRLQEMREAINPTIKVVTARGGKSGLNEQEKKERYERLILEWLAKYGVPFDEVSFQKEYANLYIDDQAIGPFDQFDCGQSAFTGNKVVLTDSMVIKSCKSALFEFEWYKEAGARGFEVPVVLFCNDECIITSRICATKGPDAGDFIPLLDAFKGLPNRTSLDYDTYLENIPTIEGSAPKTLAAVAGLETLCHDETFFHGDLSTTNVLCRSGVPYLIDPNVKHIFGSYLTDAGKAAFSLIAYEAQFPEAQKIADAIGPEVWHFAVAEGLRVCKFQPKYISIVNNIADVIAT